MKNIYVALDIEKTGGMLIKHKVLSIGFIVGDAEGTVLQRQKFNIAVKWPTVVDGTITSYGDFEPRTWDEFWSKLDKSVVDMCLHDPEPEVEECAWKNIACFIDGLELVYPNDEYKIKFLTDCADFDVACVNYGLERFANRLPMRYSTKKRYRNVCAVDDMFYMLPKNIIDTELEKINKLVKHDHNPVNDAYFHYLMFLSVSSYKDKITVSE